VNHPPSREHPPASPGSAPPPAPSAKLWRWVIALLVVLLFVGLAMMAFFGLFFGFWFSSVSVGD
jgi:predicted lipid-binding transport protein (Tim44 family)